MAMVLTTSFKFAEMKTEMKTLAHYGISTGMFFFERSNVFGRFGVISRSEYQSS